jgi:hypothetical protein
VLCSSQNRERAAESNSSSSTVRNQFRSTIQDALARGDVYSVVEFVSQQESPRARLGGYYRLFDEMSRMIQQGRRPRSATTAAAWNPRTYLPTLQSLLEVVRDDRLWGSTLQARLSLRFTPIRISKV